MRLGCRAASLDELHFCHRSGGRGGLKLRAAMLAAFKEPYRDLEHVPAWLYALSCFGSAAAQGRQPPGSRPAAAAEELARELMREAEECMRALIILLHQVRSSCLLTCWFCFRLHVLCRAVSTAGAKK